MSGLVIVLAVVSLVSMLLGYQVGYVRGKSAGRWQGYLAAGDALVEGFARGMEMAMDDEDEETQ